MKERITMENLEGTETVGNDGWFVEAKKQIQDIRRNAQENAGVRPKVTAEQEHKRLWQKTWQEASDRYYDLGLKAFAKGNPNEAKEYAKQWDQFIQAHPDVTNLPRSKLTSWFLENKIPFEVADKLLISRDIARGVQMIEEEMQPRVPAQADQRPGTIPAAEPVSPTIGGGEEGGPPREPPAAPPAGSSEQPRRRQPLQGWARSRHRRLDRDTGEVERTRRPLRMADNQEMLKNLLRERETYGYETMIGRISRLRKEEVQGELEEKLLLVETNNDRDFDDTTMGGISDILRAVVSVPTLDEKEARDIDDPLERDRQIEEIREWKESIMTEVIGRIRYHELMRAQRARGSEAMAGVIQNLEERFHKQIFNSTKGIDKAIEILSGYKRRPRQRVKFQDGREEVIDGDKSPEGAIQLFKWVEVQKTNNGAYFRNEEGEGVETIDELDPLESLLHQIVQRNPQETRSVAEAEAKNAVWLYRKKLEVMDKIVGTSSYREKLGETINKGDMEMIRLKEDYKLVIKRAWRLLEEKKVNRTIDAVSKVFSEIAGSQKREVTAEEKTIANSLSRLILETEKAFNLGEKALHITFFSHYADGPRWKEDYYKQLQKQAKREGKDPNQVDKAAKPESVKVKYAIADKGEEIEVDLAKPENWGEKEHKALGRMRKLQPYLIKNAWNKAWRQFWVDNYDKIDYNQDHGLGRGNTGSFIGKGFTPVRRILFTPGNFERPQTEAKGWAAHLRRYTHINFLPMMLFTGRADFREQLVDSWGSDIAIIMGSSTFRGRLEAADKARANWAEGDNKVLSDTAGIMSTNPDDNVSKAIKGMPYLQGQEWVDTANHLIRGIIDEQLNHADEIDYPLADVENIEAFLRNNVTKGNISVSDYKEIDRLILGNPFFRELGMEISKVDFIAALWTMLNAFFKAMLPK